MSRASQILLAAMAVLAVVPVFAQSSSTTVSIHASQPGAIISSNLFGIFFEEINSAGEGGIYAELIRNRSFEDATNSVPFWSLTTGGTAAGQISLDASLPLSATNRQALALTMASGSGSVGAANSGWFGMSLTQGATYNLGFYARAVAGFTGAVAVSLESSNGSIIYAQTSFSGLTTGWQHYTASLVPNTTDANARIVLRISQVGTAYLDFVSLFPAATFNGRTNGLRPDLANSLLNLQPSFMRFPGGSWVDGSSLSNAYHWEPTIGDPANRTGRANIWGYMVSNGLGYHEYLQMCEDLGAQPLFDINCGMDVHQNSVGTTNLGPWVQEALDAIQYANGATNTYWGAQRAANGHPTPFNLQYMEIGNENSGSAYNANYGVFYNIIKSNYPAMHLIANSFGTIPTSAKVEYLDEHYYESAAWFAQNSTKYDSYSRSGPKIFVGEYAVAYNIGPGFAATLQNALGEAAWMTGLERNSEVVALACYAPLFCNLNNQDWTPNLIYFNGTQVYGTPSYYVQQMFSKNRGDFVLPTTVTVSTNAATTNVFTHGAIGVGSWNTAVQYTNIVVMSNGVTLYQSDFVNQGTNGWRVFNGTWSATNGMYQQTAITTDCYSTSGNTNWANYTISLRAQKTSGSEGFLVLFNFLDDNNWTWWNIGGWGNTLDGIEQMTGGSKSTLAQVSQTIALNTWYNVRIVLTGPRMQCYLGTNSVQAATNLVQDVTLPSGLYVASSYARAPGQIIVKAVNPYNTPMATTFNIAGVGAIAPNAPMVQLTSASSSDLNSLAAPAYVFPATNLVANSGTNFSLTLPANSLSILRLQASGVDFVTNLLLQLPSPIYSGQLVASTVYGRQSGSLVNLSTNASAAIVYASADTNIALVDVNGNVTGVGTGTTTIIATYTALGISATQAVQVIYVPPILAHRYSFGDAPGSTTIIDSIGGVGWNGTLPNGGTLAGGQVTLSAAGKQYVQLPAGILSNYSAVTIEAWVTFPDQLPANCFFFGFGNVSGSAGVNYIFCAPQSGRMAITAGNYSSEQNAYGNFDFSFHTNLHVAAVFNPPLGYLALYTNGILAGINNSVTTGFGSVSDVYSYIGRSLYSGDPYPDFSLDEFRIYSGALSGAEITASQLLGQNQLLSSASPKLGISFSSGALMLSWPLASAGYTVLTTTNLAGGNWVAASVTPQVIGNQWQVTLPVGGTAQFYQLRK